MKFLVSISIATLLLTSCGTQKSSASAYYSTSQRSDEYSAEQKIIYSSSIDLIVAHPDSTSIQLANLAAKYRGYMNESGTFQAILRVRSSALDSAMIDIARLGKVTRKNIQGKDVGEEYLDYAIRLENAEKARARYLELLAKAETIEAALLVEKELERLNGTIEVMKGKMTRIDHLVDYSTITVHLKEKTKPGIIGYAAIGVYKGIKWFFVRN